MSSLAELVKAGQKGQGGSGWRRQWEEFALTCLGGTKDPAKHEDGALHHFVSVHCGQFQHEPWFQEWSAVHPEQKFKPPAGVRELVDIVKAGQKCSEAWKNAWGEYCVAFLGGSKDPAKHDDGALAHFVETNRFAFQHEPWFQNPAAYAAGNAKGGKGSPQPTAAYGGKGGWPAAPPPKGKGKGKPTPPAAGWAGNPTTAAPAMPGLPPPAAAASGAPTPLVDQLKALQRQDPALKAAWQVFCETYCEGIKDPARHPAQNLESFLQQQGYTPGEAAGAAARPAAPRPTSRVVAVTGLTDEVSLSLLAGYFEQYGPVQKAELGAGSGTVTFASAESAESLVNTGEEHVIGHTVVKVGAAAAGHGGPPAKRARA